MPKATLAIPRQGLERATTSSQRLAVRTGRLDGRPSHEPLWHRIRGRYSHPGLTGTYFGATNLVRARIENAGGGWPGPAWSHFIEPRTAPAKQGMSPSPRDDDLSVTPFNPAGAQSNEGVLWPKCRSGLISQPCLDTGGGHPSVGGVLLWHVLRCHCPAIGVTFSWSRRE